jgi:tetratricopeptide (TPR) repeat protein
VGLTPAGALQLRTVGAGYLVVAVAVGVYAFLGKVVPDVVTHAHTYARLDSPVGYWNVLALMMVMGLVVGLALAGDRALHPAWRVLAAVGCAPLCLTFFFTLSRGGWVALAVALVVYFTLSTARLASFASLAVIVLPVAAALWSVRGLETLFTATTDDALRTLQGHALLRWMLLALAITAAAQLVVALIHRSVPWPSWLRLAAGVAIAVVLVAGVTVGSWRFLEARGGSAWVKERVHTFIAGDDPTGAAEGTTRLISLNTGRPPLWKEALQQSRSARALGTGAGTFVFTNDRFRETPSVVKHAHSQWFEVLSGLGVVGLGLFVAAIGLFLAAAIRNPFRDRRDPLRPLVVALQAGMVAFVVHMSWDWDWNMAAVGVVFLLFAATCSSYLATREAARKGVREWADAGGASFAAAAPEDVTTTPEDVATGPAPPGTRAQVPPVTGPAGRGGTWPLRAAASALLVLLAVAWLFPYMSGRAEKAALVAASEGDPAAALVHVRRAVSLDPLAVDPLIMQSQVLQQLGRNGDALTALRRAQRLQPDNYEAYYQEGVLLLKAFNDRAGAIAALRRALALNPLDADSRYELEIATRRR